MAVWDDAKKFIIGPGLTGLVAGVIASIFLPAITRPWSDRPKEVELQSTLTADLAEGATSALSGGRALALDLLPALGEQRAAHRALERARARPNAGRANLQRARQRLNAAKQAARLAEAEKFNQVREDWLRASVRGRTKFVAFFEEPAFVFSAWSIFTANLENWLRLSKAINSCQREFLISELKAYLGPDALGDPQWQALAENPPRESQGEVDARFGYETIRRILIAELDRLVQLIIAADSKVHVTDGGEVLAELIPFVDQNDEPFERSPKGREPPC